MDETFKKELEMRMNVKKTKVMVCERENSTRIHIKIQKYRNNRTDR